MQIKHNITFRRHLLSPLILWSQIKTLLLKICWLEIFTVSDPANQDHIYDFSPEGSSSNPISSDTFPFESDRRESQCRSARRGVRFQEKSQGQERTERESVYYCFQNDALTCLPADIQQPLWQNLNPKPGKDTFVDTGKLQNAVQSICQLFICSNIPLV